METHVDQIKITIDGKKVLVDPGTSILEAARQNDIHIPTLCHHPALTNWGGCRICVVEVDGSPKLAASCVTPVRAGMGVVTSNDRIIESRRTILEYLLAERNHNCMFCPQSGNCELQELAYELQVDHLSVPSSFDAFPTDITSEYLAIDHNRCILCGRCVRACQEISGAHVLNFNNRGPHNLIGLDLNETREASTCLSCGVCMQVCPTGAIYDRYRTHYAVKGHDTTWQATESVCPQCGLLCPATFSVHDNTILKIDGKLMADNGRPDNGQLCYRGRFEVLKTMGRRLTRPMVRNGEGSLAEEDWEKALDLIAERLRADTSAKGSGSIAGLASSMNSNEALLFFRDLMDKGWGAGVIDTLDGACYRTVLKGQDEEDVPLREASWKMIPKADYILIAGADPYESQPIISSLIRKCIFENKTTVSVVGKEAGLYPFATHHLPLNEGEKPLLIQALLDEVRVIETDDKKGVKAVSSDARLGEVGLDATNTAVFHDIARSIAAAGNPLFITGEGLIAGDDGAGFTSIVRLARLKGLLPDAVLRLILLKPFGNSSGAWKLKVASAAEPAPMERGTSCVLFLAGEQVSDPDLLERLTGIGFLTVISPYIPESLIDKADVFIPSPMWMEEDGTFTSLDGFETGYKKRVLEPPPGVWDSWQILSALAERTGFHPHFETLNDLSEAARKEMGG
ncbi:MAG: molybdopterin-dependent oxidoreductase [Deltaproteobacteria bacterium]|nr:molybdopterin-dependent oxidoreductase [Deltaproteobacteria bacterium]